MRKIRPIYPRKRLIEKIFDLKINFFSVSLPLQAIRLLFLHQKQYLKFNRALQKFYSEKLCKTLSILFEEGKETVLLVHES